MVDFLNTLNENQGALMVLLTGVYVAATLAIVLAQMHSNRVQKKSNELTAENINTMVRLERERNKPKVFLNLEVEDAWVWLTLENHGNETAFDIRIESNPKIERVEMNGQEKLPIVENGAESLPPGAEHRLLFDTYNRVEESNESLVYEGRVLYRSREGEELERGFRADLNPYRIGGKPGDYYPLKKIAKHVEKISKSSEKLASGKATSLLRIISEEDYQDKMRERREAWEAKHQSRS